MRKKKVPSNFDTIIGKHTNMKGDIECAGSLRVDGSITGDISTEGNVLLGKEGFIKGRVDAVNVQLSGKVEGNVKATGILRIMSTASLLGDVEVKSFVADEGAVFQGNCKMLDYEDEKPKPKAGRSRSRSSKSVDKINDDKMDTPEES